MIDGRRVAVVIPAFDEERLVGRTVRTVPSFVDDVVLVDDASRDRTVEEALRVGDGRLILVRHAENLGVGAAIGTGYREAFVRGAEVVAVMAGDAQMDPRDLPALLRPILAGRADYAKGTRLRHPRAFARMPLVRYLANHVLSLFTRLATGYAVSDSQCGYTAISRGTIAALDWSALYPRYGYPNDLLGRLALLGATVEDTVVRPVYGEERSGISLFTAAVRIPLVILRTFLRRLQRPKHVQAKCVSAS